MAPWLLLQLADGAFPSGAFAHSSGLEAAVVLGGLDERAFPGFLEATLRQVGRAQLPFVRACAEAPVRLAELDEAFDATLPLRGPNAASRAQGRALAKAATRVWPAVAPVGTHADRGPGHHAPVFGALAGALGLGADDALAACLHGAARGMLSAAVRLGIVGPLEAQHLLAERAGALEAILAEARATSIDDAATTAPWIEIYGALHERLDGRMFQS